MTIAAVSTGAFIVIVILIWNAQRVLGMRLTAIQTELGEVNLAVLELFKTALDANRRADLKAKPAISGGGEIRRPAHIASGLEAELDEVDALCAKLITLVPPANAVPLVGLITRGSPLHRRLLGLVAGTYRRHDGNRGGGAIDRLEGGRLLFLGGNHDLAWHAFKSHYRRGRGAVLAVDDGELAALERGDNNRCKARPGKGPSNAVDVLASLADDRTLIRRVDDEVRDLQPLQHGSRTGGNGFGLLEALD
jgi:hypothetical protein